MDRTEAELRVHDGDEVVRRRSRSKKYQKWEWLRADEIYDKIPRPLAEALIGELGKSTELCQYDPQLSNVEIGRQYKVMTMSMEEQEEIRDTE